MSEKKLAILFPGIGYHKDKPLLYYATKLVRSLGYETIHIEYREMPQKIIGDPGMMKKAAELALSQSEEQLAEVDWDAFSDVVFIGKSIGTVALARYVQAHEICAKQVWYTPVEATFGFGTRDAIAFIGDADPWSNLDEVRALASAQVIPLDIYPGGNHSLECEDVGRNIKVLADVMKKTEAYLRMHS